MLDLLEHLRRSSNESATVEFKSNLNELKAERRADLIERRGSKSATEWRLKGPG